MFRSAVVIGLCASLTGLGGCATQAETIGAASGAAIGAAVGGGRAMPTIGGALLGYGAGKVYDERKNR